MFEKLLFVISCCLCINYSLNAFNVSDVARARFLSNNFRVYFFGTGNCPALDERNFAEADLSNAILNQLYLSGTNLNGANLNGTNLNFSRLTGATFIGADLRNINLTGAILINTNLTGANLFGADLSDSIGLTNAQKAYARTHGAINVPRDEPETN